MGLDYGDKTIGVAVSDSLRLLAHGVETIRRDDEQSIKKSISRLKEIILEHGVNTIVVGYPKNMDGTEGVRCEKTNDFVSRLKRNFKKIDIVLWDERLTTVAANRVLSDVSLDKKHAVVDKVAAVLILQGYLDYINREEDKNER